MADYFEDWPVLPKGVEGVLRFNVPPGYEPPPPGDCAICGEPIAEDAMVIATLGEDGMRHASCDDAAHGQKQGPTDA